MIYSQLKKYVNPGNIAILFLLIIVITRCYRHWFTAGEIIGGDWPYYTSSYVSGVSFIPQVWTVFRGNGLGGLDPQMALHFFESFLIVPFVQILHIPWSIVYRIGWFMLFLAVGGISVFRLSLKIIRGNIVISSLSALIYLTNTYILMIASGGQMGFVLAYAFVPLAVHQVLHAVILFESFPNRTIRETMSVVGRTALVYALLILFDPRIFYITFAISLCIAVMHPIISGYVRRIPSIFSYVLVLPFILSLLTHTFWLLPYIIVGVTPLDAIGTDYSTKSMIDFFSFADFSNTISLLHPNWPENIFGKVYFLKPEFLVLPMLAFFFLIVHNRKRSEYRKLSASHSWTRLGVLQSSEIGILLFVFTALLGIFLAKGTKPPFGELYAILFDIIPGFSMFRDPTKWYVLVSLAYSLIIPYSLSVIAEVLAVYWDGKFRKFLKVEWRIVIPLVFILFWSFTIRESVIGELGGTFASNRSVPQSFRKLDTILQKDTVFSRVLWVPKIQRFSHYSLLHPAIEAQGLFSATDSATLIDILVRPESEKILTDLSIKYVIVPEDPFGEIFVSDRKYSDRVRMEYIHALDAIPYLGKIQDNTLSAYYLFKSVPLFSVDSGEIPTYTAQSQSDYRLSELSSEGRKILSFSQKYHPGWRLSYGNNGLISATMSESGLVTFLLPEGKISNVSVFFVPQKMALLGFLISALMGVLCLVFMKLRCNQNLKY